MSHGRHKAPKRCCDHLGALEEAQAEIKLLEELITHVSNERDRLQRAVWALRKELTGESHTEVLSQAQIRAQMRRTAPEAVPVTTPEGSTMMLPVGKIRARRAVRPSWAAT